MSRFPRLAVLAAAAALLAAAAPVSAPASGDGPTATASKACSVNDSRSYGTTYVLAIRARNVGCRKARKRVRAFHACRDGARGRCPNLGRWNCHENRTFGTGSFTSKVTLQARREAREAHLHAVDLAPFAALAVYVPEVLFQGVEHRLRGQLGALAVQVDPVRLADDLLLAVDLHRVAVLAAGREQLDHVE